MRGEKNFVQARLLIDLPYLTFHENNDIMCTLVVAVQRGASTAASCRSGEQAST